MAHKKHQRPRALTNAAAICAALFLVITFVASRTFQYSNAQAVAPARVGEAGVEGRRESAGQAARPGSVANSSSAIELGRKIDRLIDEGEFKDARWGVQVTRLRDGRVLYARNADKTFAPASNLKLYTTAVALDLLGADYTWRTSVYADAEPDRRGVVAGDLILYGRGAPDLSSFAERDETKSSLDRLADDLYARGLRRVRGNVVGDESYFRGDPLGDGWLWNDVQWYFGAEVSALSINDNEVSVYVTPAAKPGEAAGVRLKPETTYAHVLNDTNTAERSQPATIGITRGLSDNEVRVWGEFPAGGRGLSARLSVHRPALWAATLFRDALKRRGIEVEGEARARDARESEEREHVVPERAVELASLTGETLGSVVRRTNKESINLNAELILRTLGKEKGSTVPALDPKRARTRGDDEAGTTVVRQWLAEHGIPVDSLALHDGSGLSRLNLVTPEATVRLLAVMLQTSSAARFRDSLPVAGRDGTLKFRLRSTPGRVEAKTGTLTYVNSLSGYATAEDDEVLAFSIICNDETSAESSTPVIDAIAALLASYQEAGQ